MCCFKLEKKNQVSLVEDSAVVHFTTNWFLLISQIPSEMVLQSTKPDLIHLLPMSYATYYLFLNAILTPVLQAQTFNLLCPVPQHAMVCFPSQNLSFARTLQFTYLFTSLLSVSPQKNVSARKAVNLRAGLLRQPQYQCTCTSTWLEFNKHL